MEPAANQMPIVQTAGNKKPTMRKKVSKPTLAQLKKLDDKLDAKLGEKV
jgi:hypothetical protein